MENGEELVFQTHTIIEDLHEQPDPESESDQSDLALEIEQPPLPEPINSSPMKKLT
jgi:hypothetical protein